jgi:hypothetical protein
MSSMSKRQFDEAVSKILDGAAYASRLRRALKAKEVSSSVEYDDLLYAFQTTDASTDQFVKLLDALQDFSYKRNEKSLR